MENTKHCETCAYWGHMSEGSARCHRFPPIMKDQYSETYFWDWCGEYFPTVANVDSKENQTD